MNKEAFKYFVAAALALILTVINLVGLKHDQDAAKAAEEAKQAASRTEQAAKAAVEISSGNSSKLDRNYRRWDDFAKENPHVVVPPQKNGEKHP